MNRTIKWISSLVIVLLFSTACELGLGGPTYVPEPVELSVLVLPSDKGYVEIDGSIITPGIPVQVKKGKLVNLVARSRDEGWEFARWERDLAGINSEETLVMDRSKVVRAVFTSVSPPAATPTPRTTKAEQKPIVFAGLNWDTAKIQNAIARFIVEEGYGNATDSVSEDRNSLFLDLVDGDIDVFMEIWLPNQQDVWDNAMANGSVISLGKSLDDNWQSAFVVPTCVVEANPDLKSIQDIRKFKELFPKGSGGNVLLITCLAAWKCSGINESQVKAYGLDDIIEFQDPGSTAALFASLEGAYAKKEPWLGYMWGPSTKPTVELDLTRLEEPQCGVEQQPADGCAYPDVRIRIAVHPGLVERAPDVIEMLRKWDFAAATELAARRYMADTEATFEETAIWYLKNEEDVWTQWVPADVAQAIRDALSILPALPAAATPVPGPTPTPIPTPVLPLAASFSMDVSSGRAPFIVRFSDASQGLVTSWQWDFGDGGSSTEQDPTHEYTAAGSHTVRLTVTGPEGNDVVVLPGAISVGPGPLAEVDMPPAPISVQAEITIQLSAKAVDQFGNEISDVGFTWNAIGTAGSIDRSGLFTAGTEAGTYEGLVMVTSTDGEQHRQASYDVTITPGPVSRVVVEPAEVTLDIGVTQPFTFTALDEFGNQVSDVSATWSVPPGLGTIDSDAVLTVGTKAGEFPGAVRVDAVKGTDRASATAGVSVAPDPLFSIDIEPVTTIVRLGATQRFTATGLDFFANPIPGLNFAWETTGGVIEQVDARTADFHGGTPGSHYEVKASAQFRDSTRTGMALVGIPPGWMRAGNMAEPRRDHAAVLLDDGTVLVVGGTRTTPELYDPSTGIFTVLGRPNCAHVQGFVATPLPDGSVLVLSAGANPRCAETYDPTTGMFTRTGTPNADHNYGSATLLGDGRVLVAGGRHSFTSPDESHTIAEIYDPATGIFTLTGSLNEHRNAHAAVLLPNGKVLIVGGSQTTTPGYGKGLDVAEIYDPAIGDFSVVGKMAFSCSTHLYWSGVILLTDGTVLVAGCAAASAEIFDPASNTFSRTEDMVTQHSGHTATLLPDGTVMVAGGSLNPAVELYDPVTGRFSSHSSFPEARQQHTATLLPTGEVLIIGGSVFLDKGGSRDLDSALVYVP